MSDFPDGSVLLEATSGRWYRVAPGAGRGTMLIDLPNEILLAINVSSKMIEVLIKDENEIFHRSGDISFENKEGENTIHLFFESLKELQLDHNGAKIENPFHEITSVFAKLDLKQAKQWWDKNSF
jgi:hypothetical protein